MKREVHLYHRGQSLLVQSFWEIEPGLSVIGEHCEAISSGVLDGFLGAAILAALEESVLQGEFRGFASLKPRLSRLHECAGVKSEAQFMKGSRSIVILADYVNSMASFVPTSNVGKNGFSQRWDLALSEPWPMDPDALGRAARTALEHSSS